MEFLLILSEDTELVATDADRARLAQQTGEYAMRLVGEGRLRGGGQLRPAHEARVIRGRGGDTRILDGPFTEAKEVIAGWMLIEAGSLDEAVRVAADCPNVQVGSVEVREGVPRG
ncbi:MAG: YciI family protein [Betaproteobacteria bacterium]